MKRSVSASVCSGIRRCVSGCGRVGLILVFASTGKEDKCDNACNGDEFKNIRKDTLHYFLRILISFYSKLKFTYQYNIT